MPRKYAGSWRPSEAGLLVPVTETFSKRLKQQQRAGLTDVYHYDGLSPQFRGQVVHLLIDSLGQSSYWYPVRDIMCRELGRMSLTHISPLSTSKSKVRDECVKFISDAPDEQLLDFLEPV